MRFLVEEGWLAHYLDFSGERLLPPMRRCSTSRSGSTRATGTGWRSAMQMLARPQSLRPVSGNRRHEPFDQEPDLGRRAPRRHRGHQPRAGGRRAIARIKQILAE